MALTKTGTGLAYLSGVNTYTGNTVVNGGTLYLVDPSTIGNSTLINITSGATLDVTYRGDSTLTLNSGQTLTGGGSVNGTVASQAGSTINPGGGIAVSTLTVGSATLGGKLIMDLNRTNTPVNCDQLSGSITYGGTLLATNIGPALQTNDTFQLFSGPVSGFSGVSLATTDATGNIYTWTNKIGLNGSIAVLTVVAPVTVNTNSTNITALVSGGMLTMSWPLDHTGWTLEVQTNGLGTGLGTNWFRLGTNNPVSVPIVATNGSVFYRLVYP